MSITSLYLYLKFGTWMVDMLQVPPGTNRPERTSGLSGLFGLTQLLSEQTTARAQPDGSNDTFGQSAAFSLGNLPPLASLKFQLYSIILFYACFYV